jgi:hypothetical protein
MDGFFTRISQEEAQMVKCMILAASLIAALVVLADRLSAPAQAQSRAWQMRSGSYCPAGTCGKNGGHRPRYIANCSASNCRR